MTKTTQLSNRNKIRQEVPIKDEEGNVIGKKAIFHEKKMNKPQYADRKQFWNHLNTIPKPKSKRQRKLNGEIE